MKLKCLDSNTTISSTFSATAIKDLKMVFNFVNVFTDQLIWSRIIMLIWNGFIGLIGTGFIGFIWNRFKPTIPTGLLAMFLHLGDHE